MWNCFRKNIKPVDQGIEKETVSAIPVGIVDALASIHGKNPEDLSSIISSADLFPVTAEVAREAAEYKASHIPGNMVVGQGIYVGQWHVKDETGKSLGKIFNVYAAPEDFLNWKGESLVVTYSQAVSRVRALWNWHGYNGSAYVDAQEIHEALVDGSYKGEWVIPPIELLRGVDRDFKTVNVNNLFALQDKGVFKDHCDQLKAKDHGSVWYWSSSLMTKDTDFVIAAILVNDNGICGYEKKGTVAFCRPVRFVEVCDVH